MTRAYTTNFDPYMANGGSPLPTSRATTSRMPIMLSPSPVIEQDQGSRHTLLQPHQRHIERASFETLTSIASSNQTTSTASTQPRRPKAVRNATYPATSELDPTYPTRSALQRHLLQYDIVRASARTCSLPPLPDLPRLHTSDAALHRSWHVEDDQFLERHSDDDDEEMMTPATPDFSCGTLYGFPYGMGVPNAMEQRARAIAEAEEVEYQKGKEVKRKARTSGRFGSTLRSVSLQRVLPWSRRGQR